MSYPIQFLLVLLLMTIADICWTYYFIKIEERKSISAGIWGALIYICGAFTITSYMEDKSLIIAAIIGSFLGTYISVEYKKRKEKKNEQNQSK